MMAFKVLATETREYVFIVHGSEEHREDYIQAIESSDDETDAMNEILDAGAENVEVSQGHRIEFEYQVTNPNP